MIGRQDDRIISPSQTFATSQVLRGHIMNDPNLSADDANQGPKSPAEEVVLSEAERRRKRTIGYLKLWGIEANLSTLSIPLEATSILATTQEIIGKAKVFCLLSLKGQGLTLREVFAFADAYGVWEHVSVAENNYILDEAAPESDDVQYAWRYEALNALLWALGHSKHLGFPVEASDPAKAVERCMQLILQPSTQTPGSAPNVAGEARVAKEILDAADVAFALNAIAPNVPVGQPPASDAAGLTSSPGQTVPSTDRQAGSGAPVDLHRGVVYERAFAFRWLLNPAQ